MLSYFNRIACEFLAVQPPQAVAITPQSDTMSPKDFNRQKYGKSKISEEIQRTRDTLSSRKSAAAKKAAAAYRKAQEQRAKRITPHSRVGDFVAGLLDQPLSRAEDWVAFLVAVRGAQTYASAFAIAFLYFKTFTSDSIARDICQFVFGVASEEHARTLTQQSGFEDWIAALKTTSGNLSALVRSPFFDKFGKLISAAVCLGLLEKEACNFSIAGLEIFSAKSLDTQKSGVDLLEMVMSTVVYFIEGGYVCFTKGNIDYFTKPDDLYSDYSDLIGLSSYVATGNLELVGGTTEAAFEEKLERTIFSLKSLAQKTKGPEKTFYSRMMVDLTKLRSDFLQRRVSGGLREAPFCISFYGKSAVGKSTICASSMVSALGMNGFENEDKYILTMNMRDKYESTYKGYINGVILDDYGNTKADFVERPPTDLIINLVNNAMVYANKAEADQKGMIPMAPKVVCITTNVKNLESRVYSNEPVSILRRCHMIVTVRLREKYMKNLKLDSSAVRRDFGDDPLPDIWELDLEEVIPIRKPDETPDEMKFETIVYNGKVCKAISVSEYIEVLSGMSADHFAHQKHIVSVNRDLHKKLTVCKSCSKLERFCKCIKTEPHFGWDDVRNPILRSIEWMEASPFAYYMNYVPDRIMHGKYTHWICDYILRNDLLRWYYHWFFVTGVSSLIAFVKFFMQFRVLICSWVSVTGLATNHGGVQIHDFGYIVGFWFVSFVTAQVTLLQRTRQRAYSAILRDRPQVQAYLSYLKQNRLKIGLATFTVGAVMYKAWKHYKRYQKLADQGTLSPTSLADIEARDKESNPWMGVSTVPLPVSGPCLNATFDHVQNKVKKNLVYVSIPTEDGRNACVNGFYVKSNLLLIPKHVFPSREVICKFTRGDCEKIGTTYSSPISPLRSVQLNGQDLVLVQVSNGPDYANLVEYFPLDKCRNVLVTQYYRNREGEISEQRFRTNFSENRHNGVGIRFYGSLHVTPLPTFDGECMATMVADSKFAFIAGFHLGGVTGERDAVSTFLTKGDIESAIESLAPSCLPHASSGTLPQQFYGVETVLEPAVHYKSPVNYLSKDQGNNVVVYGACIGRSTPRSSVETSILSPHVEEVCGVPQQWGPPKLKGVDGKSSWEPWNAWLTQVANPCPGFSDEALNWAIDDYANGMISALQSAGITWEDMRPLSEMQTVCGIDGKRFIDRMPASTSPGFPLSGPKSDYLTELSQEDFPDFSCPRALDPMFWEEANRIKSCYLRRERAYPVFKACQKDEPTDLSKDKVRIFQSAPLAFQLVIRQYCLPLGRLMSLFPHVSECAVGINSNGPEWEDLYKHVTKFGEENIIAGDYSKYDQRMPAQVISAAYEVYKRIYAAFGANDIFLRMLDGISTDLGQPVVAMNGTLIQLCGSHVSGENMTVYVNCTANSLYLRMAWYHMHKSRGLEVIPFREGVALSTYGDDNIGSVREDRRFFNILSFSEYMKAFDVKFTMPDKESTIIPFLKIENTDFLKRRFRYMEELGQHVAPLEELSIFKSLHANLHSKVCSQQEISAQCIDGALREWFFHGKEVYEHRRQQMQEVAAKAGISEMCLTLNDDFDSCVLRWKDKYAPT